MQSPPIIQRMLPNTKNPIADADKAVERGGERGQTCEGRGRLTSAVSGSRPPTTHAVHAVHVFAAVHVYAPRARHVCLPGQRDAGGKLAGRQLQRWPLLITNTAAAIPPSPTHTHPPSALTPVLSPPPRPLPPRQTRTWVHSHRPVLIVDSSAPYLCITPTMCYSSTQMKFTVYFYCRNRQCYLNWHKFL